MLWTIAILLVVFWVIGLIASIGGALIHVLLVFALVLIILQMIQGRRKTQ